MWHSRLGCEPFRHLIYIAALAQIPPKLARLFVPSPRHATVAVLQARPSAVFPPEDSSRSPQYAVHSLPLLARLEIP